LFLKSPPELILASTSRYRRELLTRLGTPFSCQPPGVDERAQPGERAEALVSRLALAKALAVAANHPNACVVGSDQLAVRIDAADGEVLLGKPGSRAACTEQLRGCSGQTVSFLTAVAVVRQEDGSRQTLLDCTRVQFRPLELADIERYVDREQPYDCAGGFKSEGLGISLCESITSSDPTALIGLPLLRLAAALRAFGFQLP
jgi:septum formation protein